MAALTPVSREPAKVFVPRPWQKPMVAHLTEHKRCALWAGMGVGKTAAILAAVEVLRMVEDVGKILVVAPLRVARAVWVDEAARWEQFRGLEVVPIVGSLQERLRALRTPGDVYTINYENLTWLVNTCKDTWDFQTVVADESTRLKSLRLSFRKSKTGKTFLAGQGGSRARALGRVAHSKVDRFYELTGTPSPNGLKDLWGQIWFLDGGVRLGRTYEAFTQRWFRQGYDGFSLQPLPHAEKEIYAALADICLTIDGADWFDLREPIYNNIPVDLPPAARKLYQDMETEMFMALGDRTVEAFGAAARTQKCHQVSNGAVYLDPLCEGEESKRSKEWALVHDEKLAALESVFEEANGAPVLVAYKFRSDLARLLKAFPRGRHLKTKQDEDDFKAGKIPYLFFHPQSAGHGIDGFQHVCNIICFFSVDWNLEEYQQSIGRIGPVRQMQAGLDRAVYVHHIVARDTIDEIVLERQKNKRDVQDLLLEAMKRRHKR